MPKRVLVIGAGPMGIAAAIGALDRGHDVTVLERDAAGASLRSWGPARFFSPLRMNVSARMRELLGADLPDGEALLTGPEFADAVLEPLASRAPLAGRIRTGHRVVAIGRRGLTRTAYAGHPLRAERPFRVLCENVVDQTEETFEAEVVLDASGGLAVPRAFGAGGLPARGESRLARPAIRTLGELAARADELRGKRVLVVGDGHSAANAINFLSGGQALLPVQTEGRGTGRSACPPLHVVWAVKSPNRRPIDEVSNDPLPERSAIVGRANALAAEPPHFLRVERRAMIDAVAQNNGHVVVSLTGGRIVEADAIAAFTGYRPESAYLSELAVEISPVSEGGARLHRAISNVTDCLSVPKVAPRDLETGEAGFYFVGSRGYGRSRTFLLQTGLAQLETILDAIA